MMIEINNTIDVASAATIPLNSRLARIHTSVMTTIHVGITGRHFSLGITLHSFLKHLDAFIDL
jgi:hypothetical protein